MNSIIFGSTRPEIRSSSITSPYPITSPHPPPPFTFPPNFQPIPSSSESSLVSSGKIHWFSSVVLLVTCTAHKGIKVNCAKRQVRDLIWCIFLKILFLSSLISTVIKKKGMIFDYCIVRASLQHCHTQTTEVVIEN